MSFPLPLVPFEEYMLLDDRPAYPMSTYSRLRFSGRVDRAALEAAVRAALARHPLLRAVVKEAGRGRLEWVEVPGTESIVRWLPRPADGGYPHVPGIDIRREQGMRLWVLEGEDKTDVLLQAHHACADGLGGFMFVKDVIAAYALEKGAAKRDSLRRLDDEQLRQRGEFGLTTGKLWAMARKQAVGLRGALQFFFRKAVPLVPYEPYEADSPLPPEYPAALTVEFDDQESAAHTAAATQLGVTTNDLLCRDLFLALGDWRAKWHRGSPQDWLRLSVPVNLRTYADRRLSAANVVSLVFLDRREPDFADPARLLKSIRDEMQLIKQNQLGLTFVLSLRLFRKLPGGLRRTASANRCAATCLLTNVGEVLAKTPVPEREGKLVAGDLVLEGFDCLAPLRPLTAAAFTLFRYSGRQCITLHYDPRPVTAEQAQDLLDMYARRLRETARSGGEAAHFDELQEAPGRQAGGLTRETLPAGTSTNAE